MGDQQSSAESPSNSDVRDALDALAQSVGSLIASLQDAGSLSPRYRMPALAASRRVLAESQDERNHALQPSLEWSDARELAGLVLSMDLLTERGLSARRLARRILGIDDHGDAPEVVAITTNGTTRLVPVDEPVFLLRGQDRFAAEAVEHWAQLMLVGGGDGAVADAALEHAALMRSWHTKKVPDLPVHPNLETPKNPQ